ncbi:tryptophan 7-halogenase [Catenovulum agarivorans]|uniref:tryptophan 7-halogenase n=1 Tax=Catenovulum agarivorans TaxID=1172192 RepID=UPI000313FB5B|nr:tryptophan 7-halogenase [Catenovulum agarivorans]
MTNAEQISNIVVIGGSYKAWFSAMVLARACAPLSKVTVINLPTERNLVDLSFVTDSQFIDLHKNLGINLTHLLKTGAAQTYSAVQYQNYFDTENTTIGLDLELPTFRTIELHHVLASSDSTELANYSYAAQAALNNKLILPSGKQGHISNSFQIGLQMDGASYVQFATGACQQMGAQCFSQEIAAIVKDDNTGLIKQISLVDGTNLNADLIIDCSWNSRFSQKYFSSKWQTLAGEDVSHTKMQTCVQTKQAIEQHQQPINKHLVVQKQTANTSNKNTLGLQQQFSCNGFVVTNEYIAESRTNLSQNAKVIEYQIGRIDKVFSGNLCSLGAIAQFDKPIFANSLLMVRALTYLLENFPNKQHSPFNREYLNELIEKDISELYQFYSVHDPELSNSAELLVAFFCASGRVERQLNPIIPYQRWINHLAALYPAYQVEPMVKTFSRAEIEDFLVSVKERIKQL